MSQRQIQEECMTTKKAGDHNQSCSFSELDKYKKGSAARRSTPPTPSFSVSCAGNSCSAPCAPTTQSTDLTIAAKKAFDACNSIANPLHEDVKRSFDEQIAKVIAIVGS